MTQIFYAVHYRGKIHVYAWTIKRLFSYLGKFVLRWLHIQFLSYFTGVFLLVHFRNIAPPASNFG